MPLSFYRRCASCKKGMYIYMKLMVLGGGNCQQNFIKRAKAAGHFVIVADYLPDCPARSFADVHALVSTFDTPAVLAEARANRIDGIATLGTDQPVLTAATVAQSLGLPFYVDVQTALAVTNKRVMKAKFTRHGIPTADFRLIGEGFSDSDIEGLTFPAVLKPVDSQGQRGIFLVRSIDEVHRRISQTLSFSRETKALLETFYPSDEVTVNGWADGGNVTLISVVDRVTIKRTSHIGICLAHNFPSVHLASRYDEIEALTQRIVNAFGIQNGPVYFQYLIGSDGICVNEIAMRIGGAYEDITIPLISGIDIGGMVMDVALTGRCDTSALEGYDLRHNTRSISTQLFFCRSGRVASITPRDHIMRLSGVHDVYYAIQPGAELGGIENATARAGYIIVQGDGFDDMIANVGRVFDNLDVLDENGRNLVIPYRDYPDKYLFT